MPFILVTDESLHAYGEIKFSMMKDCKYVFEYARHIFVEKNKHDDGANIWLYICAEE
jgi:hypothetical protein